MSVTLPRIASVAVIQAGLVLSGFLLFAAMPPAEGDMLLLPLLPGAPVQRLAFESGATVLGAGRLGGVVVRGARSRVMMPMLAAGVVPIAAPALLCGGSEAR